MDSSIFVSSTSGPKIAIHAGDASKVVALTRSKLTKRLLTEALQPSVEEHHEEVSASSLIRNVGRRVIVVSPSWVQEKLSPPVEQS